MPRSIPAPVASAVAGVRNGDKTYPSWVFFHCMSPEDRKAVDAHLVSIQHPLAHEPGTQEYRFKAYVSELSRA